jgi:hypothetical protein
MSASSAQHTKSNTTDKVFRTIAKVAFSTIAIAAVHLSVPPLTEAESKNSVPAVLELFTSEGCSSCPPADALLSELAKKNPNSIVVLSEHVDYWNYLGWKDPYSSPLFSERQKHYVDNLHSSSMYTPQLVVNGTAESVGNNPQAVEQALKSQNGANLSALAISTIGNSSQPNINVEFDSVPEMASSPFVANIAFVKDYATSKVTRGENQGRTLMHTNVVTKLISVKCAPTTKRMQLSISAEGSKDARMIVFLQKPKFGKIFAVGVKAPV